MVDTLGMTVYSSTFESTLQQRKKVMCVSDGIADNEYKLCLDGRQEKQNKNKHVSVAAIL